MESNNKRVGFFDKVNQIEQPWATENNATLISITLNITHHKQIDNIMNNYMPILYEIHKFLEKTKFSHIYMW